MGKVIYIPPVSNVVSIHDRKPKKKRKEDFKRYLNKGPEPPKGAS